MYYLLTRLTVITEKFHKCKFADILFTDIDHMFGYMLITELVSDWCIDFCSMVQNLGFISNSTCAGTRTTHRRLYNPYNILHVDPIHWKNWKMVNGTIFGLYHKAASV